MAAPEDAATVADLEWWLFEQYFKPHGLSFDGKTVPPVEKIAAAPDLMDMSAAPTTAFEAVFKAAFKPLMNEEISSRYLWEIISLGKLDLSTRGAEVLAAVVIAARDDIFLRIGQERIEISILHYAIGNPQFLEPLLDVPEIRRSGWGTAVDALLPGRRYAISTNHPPSEVFRIFEVLLSRVEPVIIGPDTLKKIAKWLGQQSKSFRAAQLATLHARVGTVRLQELASE
ncbi:hypothetical protein HDU87_007585 [Geranomyces variabilis]|uniref:Uncharacterized protein n=1 Tax=Geranomyces variabilis TaxID=109894 RepID=A0AAD5TEA0_9FUNG|nr:hypothetical protein HDU87_007585 [Geranomyces variabilis]